MKISVEVPFSFDPYIALQEEAPPEGIVMHVPRMKSQRDMTALITWPPIVIDVGKFLGMTVAIPFFVNWLYDTFKNASRPPKVTIRRRVIEWDKGALKRAIEEEVKDKQKTQRSDDFIVGGYVPGGHGVEELVVGEKREGDLYFVESVKNGFVPSTRRKVFDAIKGKEIDKCPFVNLPEKKGAHRMDREKMETVRWVRPRIVAEIAFNERTQVGHLRHSKFLRLRDRVDLRTKASTNTK